MMENILNGRSMNFIIFLEFFSESLMEKYALKLMSYYFLSNYVNLAVMLLKMMKTYVNT